MYNPNKAAGPSLGSILDARLSTDAIEKDDYGMVRDIDVSYSDGDDDEMFAMEQVPQKTTPLPVPVIKTPVYAGPKSASPGGVVRIVSMGSPPSGMSAAKASASPAPSEHASSDDFAIKTKDQRLSHTMCVTDGCEGSERYDVVECTRCGQPLILKCPQCTQTWKAMSITQEEFSKHIQGHRQTIPQRTAAMEKEVQVCLEIEHEYEYN